MLPRSPRLPIASLVLAAVMVPAAAGRTVAANDGLPAPALPKVYAFTLAKPYGEHDRYPLEPAVFENLLVSMRKAGFNCIHCPYRDWRLELCRKHGVLMMLDVLAWKENVDTDIRRMPQRAKLEGIVRKLRGDDAVWGYNLWNEKLDWFGRPDGKGIDDYIALLKEWDPTHPVWVGTYRVAHANAFRAKPGVHGYYDYPWERGFHWHFADLSWYRNHVPSQEGVFGSWQVGSDYHKNSYSINTSIAFGAKVVIWFIDGPFDARGNVDPQHRFFHFVRIGQEMEKLYPELGAIGRPVEVFSTPTTKWHDGKDRPPEPPPKDKSPPWGLKPFPDDWWFQVTGGEVVVGFFVYPDGSDAVYVANHNAHAPQKITFKVAGDESQVQLFDRTTGRWLDLPAADGIRAFDMREAGGELLRVRNRGR